MSHSAPSVGGPGGPPSLSPAQREESLTAFQRLTGSRFQTLAMTFNGPLPHGLELAGDNLRDETRDVLEQLPPEVRQQLIAEASERRSQQLNEELTTYESDGPQEERGARAEVARRIRTAQPPAPLDLSGLDISALPDLGLLPPFRSIILRDCRRLAALPELPETDAIDLSGCRQLSRVELEDRPSLRKLTLDNCTTLQMVRLVDVANLETISLSGCESLEDLELDPDDLYMLNLSRCSRLRRPVSHYLDLLHPQTCIAPDGREFREEVQSSEEEMEWDVDDDGDGFLRRSAGQRAITVNRLELKEQPLEVLAALPVSNGFAPLEVTFEGEPGVDAGGLRREFISLLVHGVFQPGQLPHVGSAASNDVLPILDTDRHDRALLIDQFDRVGIVLGDALMAHAALGPLFDPPFFEALVSAYRLPPEPSEQNLVQIGCIAYGMNHALWFPVDKESLQQMKQEHMETLRGALGKSEDPAALHALFRLRALRTATRDPLATWALRLPHNPLAAQLEEGRLNRAGLAALQDLPGCPPEIFSALLERLGNREEKIAEERAALERRIATLKSQNSRDPALSLLERQLQNLEGNVKIEEQERKVLSDALSQSPEYTQLREALERGCLDDLEIVRAAYEAYLAQEPRYAQVGRAVHAIAQGVAPALNANPGWQVAAHLQNRLVGSSAAEDILQNIEWQPGHSSDTQRWLEEWLHQANDEQRQNFCKALTGSPALPPGGGIRIARIGEPHLLPSCHACTRQLDLPPYATQQDFNEKMDLFVQNANVGFGSI